VGQRFHLRLDLAGMAVRGLRDRRLRTAHPGLAGRQGGFNRSSQHRIAARILGSRSRLLRESSIRASSVAVR